MSKYTDGYGDGLLEGLIRARTELNRLINERRAKIAKEHPERFDPR